MPTREGTVLLGVAASFFLLATNVMAGLLFVLDAVVLGVLVTGAAGAVAATRRVHVRRRVPRRGVEGMPLPVRLDVEARRRARFVVVEDGWPGARCAALVPDVEPGRPAVVTLAPVPARRGQYWLGPLVVRSRGPFGLFAARRRADAFACVLVWPAWRPLPPEVTERLTPVLETAARAARTRQVEEFHSVRDYRPGDSLAHVHWRSSVRRGALVVREFERPEAPGVAVVVDLDRGQPADVLDAVVRAAASLFRAALDARVDVVLMAWADAPVIHRSWEDAMDWLAVVQPQGPPLPEALARLRGATDRHLVVVTAAGSGPWPAGCTWVRPW
jgi:uncharacterized protein (DUF58 family)